MVALRSVCPNQSAKESGIPNGIRTRAAALKGRCPRPLDDGDPTADSIRCGPRPEVASDEPAAARESCIRSRIFGSGCKVSSGCVEPGSLVDGDMHVILVIRRVAAPVGHVAPALTVALDVPDALIPDHVLDAKTPCIRPGPVGHLVAEGLAG